MQNKKESIRLRKKQISDGLESLYLDIYTGGKRTYEFLKLYLLPGESRAAKAANRETMRLAEAMKAKRILEMNDARLGIKSRPQAVPFFEYFDSVAAKKKTAGTKATWASAKLQLRDYASNKNLEITDIDRNWAKGFRTFLDSKSKCHGVQQSTRLKESSQALYWTIFKCCIHEALTDGLILTDPLKGIPGYKNNQAEREFLTVEELKAVVATPCSNDGVRRAFLFSCLTGLRWSDVKALTWSDVRTDASGTLIKFRQQKTQSLEWMHLNRQAVSMIGERAEGDTLVFPKLCGLWNANRHIAQWMGKCGIAKHISFHCARHTFAVMMLNTGTDIYTVSKLLGHRSLETTKIYAKILDETKRKAIDSIPDIM